MKAARYHGFGSEDTVTFDDIPVPEPGPGQVRIKIAGATVNRTDLNARQGLYGLPEPGPGGYGLGMDAAGTVDALGPGVTGLAAGDAVIALLENPWEGGAQAEFAVAPAAAVTPAPTAASLTRAAALPVNGLTALQAVAQITADSDTVIVAGAAGGLGQLLVQVARNAGYRVIAWVRPDTDAAYVLRLGAAQVVTSADQLPPRAAAAVIDTAMIGQPAIGLIADNGRYIEFRTIRPVLDRGITQATVNVYSDAAQLRQLVTDVEAGRLELPEVTEIPLAGVADAQRTFDAGGVRARLVLVP
jgi:NADPH:quinone reductase